MLTYEPVFCVVARVNGFEAGRLAIADIVADHRTTAVEAPATRAARVFAALPGCEIYLTPDGSAGYAAFTRGGQSFTIVRAEGRCDVPPEAAEACAKTLYVLACASHPASRARTSSA
ncbi:MAG: hypothetical protein FWE35_03590 [Streptosporangiales bacterium]|jgi:hypothetical protein|nr:hypothetical protein [Streptosporangiales bacterium]